VRSSVKPVVVVSKCLGFAHCRFNGLTISSHTVDKLKPHVDFRPVCPEVEIGLGIPRDPVRIVKKADELRLIQPATGFLKGVDLNPDGSLSVDKNFQVSEDIYAAGDIASFIDWRTGERIRIEHWRLAEQLGRIAAHNMAGRESEYRSIPFFWTNQLRVNLGYMGYVKDWDGIIFQGNLAERNFAAYYVKGDRVLAAAGAGSVVQKTATAELMRTDQMPTPDELRRGSIDMEEMLK
jgi:NADPH-dependent 2,4-dienoyl-CoA reductase/sulfur reductase-like enzyme